MNVRTRIFAASVLTTGLITSGVVAATGTATAKPAYCSPSVGCSNGQFVDKGPKTPDGWPWDQVGGPVKCATATGAAGYLTQGGLLRKAGAIGAAAVAACTP